VCQPTCNPCEEPCKKGHFLGRLFQRRGHSSCGADCGGCDNCGGGHAPAMIQPAPGYGPATAPMPAPAPAGQPK
jgi:hypothetical protein